MDLLKARQTTQIQSVKHLLGFSVKHRPNKYIKRAANGSSNKDCTLPWQYTKSTERVWPEDTLQYLIRVGYTQIHLLIIVKPAPSEQDMSIVPTQTLSCLEIHLRYCKVPLRGWVMQPSSGVHDLKSTMSTEWLHVTDPNDYSTQTEKQKVSICSVSLSYNYTCVCQCQFHCSLLKAQCILVCACISTAYEHCLHMYINIQHKHWFIFSTACIINALVWFHEWIRIRKVSDPRERHTLVGIVHRD